VTPNRGVRLGPKRRNVWCSTISSMWSVVTLAAGSRSKFATLLIRSRHAPATAALGFGSVGSGTQQHGPRGSDQFDVGTDRIGVKCGQTAGAAGSRLTADSRQRYHHGGNLRKPDIPWALSIGSTRVDGGRSHTQVVEAGGGAPFKKCCPLPSGVVSRCP
jgi:hypothetical protein